MRKKLLSLLLVLSMMVSIFAISPLNVSAEDYKSGHYTYSLSNGQATITGGDSYIKGAVTIPSTLDGHKVVEIGSGAFMYNTAIKSVTIPDSVKSIGVSAFEECTGITSLTIGNGVTYIGDYAFWACEGITSLKWVVVLQLLEMVLSGDV